MTTISAIATDEALLLEALARRGWATYAAECPDAESIIAELGHIGDLLGTRTGGRAGALEEIIHPHRPDEAHPRSLSARYGLGALPFHTELSHRLRPCRYLALGCVDPGSPSVATLLLDWTRLGFSSDDLELLQAAPVLVRSGRRSFYTTILPPDHTFLRYDPGCLEAVDARGRTALSRVSDRLSSAAPHSHEWRRGDILVIDNWRVLHGRDRSEHGSGRRLARILIDA